MNQFDIPANNIMTNENAHGSISFLIDIFQDPKNLTANVNKFHSHKEIHFSYVTKGCVEFIVENHRMYLKKGEVVYIGSNSLHMSRSREQGSTYLCFNIKPEFLLPFLKNVGSAAYIPEFLSNPGLTSFVMQPESKWQSEVIGLLKHIYQTYMTRSFAFELSVASDLLQLLYIIAQEKNDEFMNVSVEKTLDQKRMQHALSYIEDHFAEKISLSDIALSLNVSKEEVCRLFKRILKTTCCEYICNYRIMNSIDLLYLTDKPIGEIARESGFDSFSYFTECFKKHSGCTPSEYRRRLLQQTQVVLPE